jgi:hypothetical protein
LTRCQINQLSRGVGFYGSLRTILPDYLAVWIMCCKLIIDSDHTVIPIIKLKRIPTVSPSIPVPPNITITKIDSAVRGGKWADPFAEMVFEILLSAKGHQAKTSEAAIPMLNNFNNRFFMLDSSF